MKTLRFGIEDVGKGNLILVNSHRPLKNDIPRDRLFPVMSCVDAIFMERQAAKMLEEITTFLFGRRHCSEIVPVSGYRDMEEQWKIYADSLRENGEEFTRKYVAIPGHSEHQTGLAIDLAKNQEEIDFIRPNFPYTGIFGHFRRLAPQYGFIERYPAGREHITGIAHEPWHFRYVGYPHSELIKEEGFTLEEYTDYLRQFPYGREHLHFQSRQRDFELFHVPVREGETSVAEISGDAPYQISGNNVDGVILTLWKGRA